MATVLAITVIGGLSLRELAFAQDHPTAFAFIVAAIAVVIACVVGRLTLAVDAPKDS